MLAVIIVTSLHRDYLPSSWVMYKPSITEVGIFIGTLGLFFSCYFLFIRMFPVIAAAEVKGIIVKKKGKEQKKTDSE